MFNTRPFGGNSIQIGPVPPERGKIISSGQLMEQKIIDQIERFIDRPDKTPIKSNELLEIIDELRKEKFVSQESGLFKNGGVSEAAVKKEVFLEHVLNQYFEQDFTKPGPSATKRHKNHEDLLKRYLSSTRSLQLIKNNFDGKNLDRVMLAVIKNFDQKAQIVEKMRTAFKAAGQKEKEQELVEKQKAALTEDFAVLADLRKRPELTRSVAFLESKMIEAAQSYMTKAELEKVLSAEQKQSHAVLLAKYQELPVLEGKTKNKTSESARRALKQPELEVENPPKISSNKERVVSIKFSQEEINKILIALEDKTALEEAVKEMTDPESVLENESEEPAKTIIHFEDLPSFEELSKISTPQLLFNSLQTVSKTLVTELKFQSAKTPEFKGHFAEGTFVPVSLNFNQPAPSVRGHSSNIASQSTAAASAEIDPLLKLIEAAAKQSKVLSEDIARQSQVLKISPERLMLVMAQFIGALKKDLVSKDKIENQSLVTEKSKEKKVQDINKQAPL